MIKIRKAKKRDVDFLFKLRNDDNVRKFFWKEKKIKKTDHIKWFNDILNDKNTLLYIVEMDGNPIGQIRFDIHGENAEVSISIISSIQGKGHGSKSLQLAQEKLLEENKKITSLNAYIKPENVASIRLFEKIGYIKTDVVKYNNKECVSMKYKNI